MERQVMHKVSIEPNNWDGVTEEEFNKIKKIFDIRWKEPKDFWGDKEFEFQKYIKEGAEKGAKKFIHDKAEWVNLNNIPSKILSIISIKTQESVEFEPKYNWFEKRLREIKRELL